MKQRASVVFRLGAAIPTLRGCLYGRVSAAAAILAMVPVSAARAGDLKGKVRLDGSSTVAPITMAAAEMFQEEQPQVRVTVGISGTGGGFKKFLDPNPDLRTDISDASRPIKQKELDRTRELGIEFIEIPVAMDGIAVVVHPDNNFCESLTVDELKRIWQPGSGITNWSQVREGFPDQPLKLYGPGTDSGTFDYFTEVIAGEEKASRSDYTASESDNMLVQGVAGDQGALGYFGFSYFEANKDKLKVLGVDPGDGRPVVPSLDIIRGGAYRPLARPLFLYVNKEAYARPEVKAFLDFFLNNARTIVEHPRVNYVALQDELYALGRQRLEKSITGTVFGESSQSGDLMKLFRLP